MRFHLSSSFRTVALWAGCSCIAPLSNAQAPAPGPAPGWQACSTATDAQARLACFDDWARSQATPVTPVPSARMEPAAPVAPPAQRGGLRFPAVTAAEGCHSPEHSELSRFWELEQSSDCGTFGIRGYRPISLSVVTASNINNQPSSGNPANTSDTVQDYRATETRLQLSIRTKLASGLLTGKADSSDSIWFGYTQQSYWQLFNRRISRPFRTTDHEPEVVYVYPTDYTLPGGWRLRYSGVGLVHQSNGQALPLSRSWNRVYLMAGMENGSRFRVQARVWKRMADGSDDNPGISDYIGRGELTAAWNVNRQNVVSATLRSSLSSSNRGSVRLEWLRALGSDSQGEPAGLRLHTQLFTGYGDSLIDYNNRRTVFSIGLSLVEW
jgi:phospholipase A1